LFPLWGGTRDFVEGPPKTKNCLTKKTRLRGVLVAPFLFPQLNILQQFGDSKKNKGKQAFYFLHPGMERGPPLWEGEGE